tara:strand:+ start:6253 stop:7026 length:774 start_codon:yes stop_codon:yes gene_type:complete
MYNIFEKYKEFKRIKKEKPYKKLNILKFLRKVKIAIYTLPVFVSASFSFSLFLILSNEESNFTGIIMVPIISTIVLSLFFIVIGHVLLEWFPKIFKKKIEKEIHDLNKNYQFNNHIECEPNNVANNFRFNNYTYLELIHNDYNFKYTSDIDFFITEFKDIPDKDFLENINIIFENIDKNKIKENDRKNLFDFIFSKYKDFLNKELINIEKFNKSINKHISNIFNNTDEIVNAKIYLKNYIDYYNDLNNDKKINALNF